MGTCWLSHAWMLKNMFQKQVPSIDRFHIESSSRAHYSESHDVGTWVGIISRICARISNTLPLRREDNNTPASWLLPKDTPEIREPEAPKALNLNPRDPQPLWPFRSELQAARASWLLGSWPRSSGPSMLSLFFRDSFYCYFLFFFFGGGWHGRCFEPSGLISFGGCGGVLGFISERGVVV